MKRRLGTVIAEFFRHHPIAGLAYSVSLACVGVEFANEWIFHHDQTTSDIAFMVSLISMPFWIPGAFKSNRARKRQKKGLCISCGYDLRATPNQ
jgi:hypothetical protein